MGIPLFLPRFETATLPSETLLAADIGGTKTSIGFFHIKGQQLSLVNQETFGSREFESFPKALDRFLLQNKLPRPQRLSLGVAGPVFNGKVFLTNLGWSLEKTRLIEETGIPAVSLINDLEATAYGLAGLPAEKLITVYEGNAHRPGNIGVMAPGTGLGEAGLYWDGHKYHPFATEGGHAHFSPSSETDLELYRFMRERHDTVSWEHLISGPGIHRIYRFLKERKGWEESVRIRDLMLLEDPSALITQAALREEDPLCSETMRIYIRLLACEGANLVLKLKATGGLLLGGGIPPKILPLIQSETFFETFINGHRMEDMLGQVPVKVIGETNTALLGAAYFGAYGPVDAV